MISIHYKLMSTLTKKDLKSSYKSLKDFIDTHNITPQQVDKCFGRLYFKHNPMFHNDRAIKKLIKFLGIPGVVVRVEYPTNDTVRFAIK